MRRALLTLSLALAAAVGTRAWADGVTDSANCAVCHSTEVGLAAREGGHAPLLDCATCHEDRRPGSVGHGHRSIPTSCTAHHETAIETHPPPARKLRPGRLRRSCLRCHDSHGSTNLHLVRDAILTRGRLHPIDYQNAGGAVSGGLVDPAMPGRGLCEVCHRTTRFYLANGHGEAHFTDDCALCHDHAASFRPVITDQSCAICHPNETARLAGDNLHHLKFAGRCTSCHAEVKSEPGPGHRASSTCADCHSVDRVAAHVPPGIAIPCTQCHDPHGTDNIRLIRDVIHTVVQGTDRSVHFDSLDGRVDGSFASASSPGTGLCEVCHTRTQFYRADGSGAPHYVLPCTNCHPHAVGFAPR